VIYWIAENQYDIFDKYYGSSLVVRNYISRYEQSAIVKLSHYTALGMEYTNMIISVIDNLVSTVDAYFIHTNRKYYRNKFRTNIIFSYINNYWTDDILACYSSILAYKSERLEELHIYPFTNF